MKTINPTQMLKKYLVGKKVKYNTVSGIVVDVEPDFDYNCAWVGFKISLRNEEHKQKYIDLEINKDLEILEKD